MRNSQFEKLTARKEAKASETKFYCKCGKTPYMVIDGMPKCVDCYKKYKKEKQHGQED